MKEKETSLDVRKKKKDNGETIEWRSQEGVER